MGVRAWISTHDAEKNVKGLAKKLTHKKKPQRDELRTAIHRIFAGTPTRGKDMVRRKKPVRTTEVLALGPGEEVMMTSEGVWEEEELGSWAPFLVPYETQGCKPLNAVQPR